VDVNPFGPVQLYVSPEVEELVAIEVTGFKQLSVSPFVESVTIGAAVSTERVIKELLWHPLEGSVTASV
jgi:hypothetical protein